MSRLGKHIKKVRTAAGYSQDRIYLEAGCSRGTMSKIERGAVDTQIGTLRMIAETIGVPLRKLVDVD